MVMRLKGLFGIYIIASGLFFSSTLGTPPNIVLVQQLGGSGNGGKFLVQGTTAAESPQLGIELGTL